MERALDLALLRGALGGRSGLPSPEELQEALAKAEVGLILRSNEIDTSLLDTAWYLHGIASVDQARDLYPAGRRRQAFLVSAHVFDLALLEPSLSREERLSFGFAAAIGYRRGGREPNATAIMNRLREEIREEAPLADHLATMSLEVGLAFLGLESRSLFRWLAGWRRQLAKLATDSELPDLTTTAFGPTHMLTLGAEDMFVALVRGNSERRERSRARLLSVVRDQAGPEDLNAKWVAAHLLEFAEEAFDGSLWNPDILPPSVPAIVRQSFTAGSPAVVTLWEPQKGLLTGSQSPLDPEVRRMVLAVPTSGGKSLVAQLLAVEFLARTDRSICYVVPTRGLGREVRRAMSQRVRLLQKETAAESLDFSSFWNIGVPLTWDTVPADVEVMTPERLGHLLRHDAEAVVDKFGMFIFDEAQLLKEHGRGFVLESVIAALDLLTRGTDHRIALISAAMGNAGSIAQWLSPLGSGLLHESDWRGPRRLHAVFNTRADWGSTTVEGGAGHTWRYRHTTNLAGLIRVRTADGQTVSLSTRGDTGWRLVRKSKVDPPGTDGYTRDSTRSTKQYQIAADMVRALGHAGSVLIVASTRSQAESLAKALAMSGEESGELTTLVDFVRQQLGSDHPLVRALRCGVGYHHAGLPTEVLEALEDAVKADQLPFLACTSTLTDGVNLPVRTVVLYDQSYPGQPEDSRLRGARLVNAMGRAGRAGRETEGWIVLVRAAEPSEQDFADLNPLPDDLAITSSLTTDSALESAAALESSLRNGHDAIFSAAGSAASFVSFVWQMLAAEEKQGSLVSSIDVGEIVGSTLMASQSAEARRIYLSIASATKDSYSSTERSARQRWPRTGTSISSARSLDAIAESLADQVLADPSFDGSAPMDALTLLGPELASLLALPEAPAWFFRTTVRGDQISVDPGSLLRDWMAGSSLPDLASSYLADVADPGWRIEQMVTAVAQQFEHYLSWTVGALVDLVNWHLESQGSQEFFCPELGGLIRYGVDDSRSLKLMMSGFRSRRLAKVVVAEAPDDFQSVEDTRAWLAGLTIAEWRATFGATTSELLDLVDFTRTRQRSLLRALLEEGSIGISITGLSTWAFSSGDLTLRPVDGEPPPASLGLYCDTELVALVNTGDHSDTQAILETGISIDLRVDAEQPSILYVSLAADDGQ